MAIDWTEGDERYCDQPEDQYTNDEVEEMNRKHIAEKELDEACQKVADAINVPYWEVRATIRSLKSKNDSLRALFDGFRDIFSPNQKRP